MKSLAITRIVFILTTVSVGAVLAEEPSQAPNLPWAPTALPLSQPTGDAINVSTVAELFQAADDIKPGGTILIADGHYMLPRYFDLHTNNVTLRSKSGNRHAVILDGANSRHGELVGITNCSGVTIADLTIQNIKWNGFKINSNKNVQRFTIRNCVIHNIWQRGVKAVKARTSKPRDCVIEYCLFYNDRPKRYSDDPADQPDKFQGNYIGGIDAMDAVGWRISDNVFIGIQGRTREGRGAIFIWQDSRDCVIERNIIVDCDVGIALGNSHKPKELATHCIRCTVRNNFVTRCPETGILADHTRDCRIVHNSIHDPSSRLKRLIRLVHENDGLEVANNLISGPPPQVQSKSDVAIHGNVVKSFTDKFINPDRGDLHLRPYAVDIPVKSVVDDIAFDFDQQHRLDNSQVGADQPESAGVWAGEHDVLFHNARVIDGTGGPAYLADVGIYEGRIMSVGRLKDTKAKQHVDASGMILCPGFVDMHNHGDRGILKYRDAENFVRQGVTTIVCGNCGSSPTDVVRFMRELRDGGAGLNVAFLIGHGSVRRAVLGDRNVTPNADELKQMQQLVHDAMEAGAAGMSTGLRYRPGAFANTDEVQALAKELKPFGGFYATHMRDEGTRIIPGLMEALQIGRKAGVPVHISHHKISSASVWGLTRQTLALIDEARRPSAAGANDALDVTLDQYPYGAGSSGIALMVPQATVAGGSAEFRKRIADTETRIKIREAVEELVVRKLYEADQSPGDQKATRMAFSRIQLARSPADASLEGKYLTQILDQRKVDVTLTSGAELIIELVAQGVGAIYHTIEDRHGGDVDRVMQHPETCIASDGGVFEFGSRHPHPRNYGTYPRVLARYVRERRLLTWEDAIRKMSGSPARRLGWRDRGLIKTGQWADVVLFDPEQISDVATFQKPHQYAVGVRHVLVRGRFVLQDGKMTGERPGRPIHSVPVVADAKTRLRRQLLEMLQSFDGRFGFLAKLQAGDELIAINANDLFGVDDGLTCTTQQQSTLQSIVKQFESLDKLHFRCVPGKSMQPGLVFCRRIPIPNGSALILALAYDALSVADTTLVGELFQGRIRQRLERYRHQSGLTK